jgi:GMP synthase-like glutamine amidotransferase
VRVACLQPVDYEGPSAIEPWIRNRGHEISNIALWDGARVPSDHSFDCLIVLGGAPVTTDEQHYPWLRDGLQLIRSYVSSGRAFLGVCLGAQLLAHAFGAQIRRNRYIEVGWHPVWRCTNGGQHPLMRGIPSVFTAFHWHQDVADVPPGGTLLASSAASRNQAFAIGARALGLQFHPEITPEKVRTFATRAPIQGNGPYVQDTEGMLAAGIHFTAQQRVLAQVLQNLLDPQGSARESRQRGAR